MHTVENLINTSTNDCKISLQHMLAEDPHRAATTALDLLTRLQGSEGQATRRHIAAAALRRAIRRIADDPTPDRYGARAGDPYNELPIIPLRLSIDRSIAKAPEETARALLATLVAIRGEPSCVTRREALRLGIMRAARALQYGNAATPAESAERAEA